MGFEPTISAGERPQTYALDRAATGTGEIIAVLLVILVLALGSGSGCLSSLHTALNLQIGKYKFNVNFGITEDLES